MNNIPQHLKGMSAVEITQQLKLNSNQMDSKSYITFLEMHLLIAIKDALCVLTDRELRMQSELAAEGRAIAFLNTVCPPRKETA